MTRHRMSILGHQDSRLALGPQKYLRVANAKRQFQRVANAHDVELFGPAQIVSKNCLPQRAAQVLVKHKR
jgi:hypothetical protein